MSIGKAACELAAHPNCFCLAQCIPQLIERINQPEVKQLHMLHRLDKQSTGVLLMT